MHLSSDLRRAFRSLARTPGLAVAAIVTLALGSGSTIAIGTIVYSILWRPIAGLSTERLAQLYPTERGALDGENDGLTLAEAEGIRDAGLFDGVGILILRNVTLTAGEPERVLGAYITPDHLGTLGIAPLLGRDFHADESRDFGQAEVALVSHGLWQRRLGGDPAAIGRTIEINQRALTVVGVLPPGVDVPANQQLYLPFRPSPAEDRDARDYWTVARLPASAEPTTLQRAIDQTIARLRGAGALAKDERGIRLVPMRQALYDSHTARILALLSALVAGVLAVACFNVANLLFARAAAREGEVAVRLALGAVRWRIAREVLAESLVLAVAGCAGGLLVGRWGLDLALATMQEERPGWMSFDFDPGLAFGCSALVVAVALLSGLAPALGAGARGLQPLLAASGRGGDRSRSRRFQRALVALQFAVSFVVLVAAFWMLASLRQLENASLGFDPDPILTVRTYLPGDAYDPPAAKIAWRLGVVDRIAALPGVASAAFTTAIPADDGGNLERVAPASSPAGRESALTISAVGVTRGFFETLGMPLVAGSLWSDAEEHGAPLQGVVINQALAERLWPGEPALGRSLRYGTEVDSPVYSVVGIAPPVPFEEIHEQTSRSTLQLYLPMAQFEWRSGALLVRQRQDGADPAALAPLVRREIAAAEPDAPVYDVLTMPARLRQSWEDRVLVSRLASVFAAEGLALAAVGLFGLLAYAVTLRTRELGIRMALGAAPRALVLDVLKDGLAIAAPGLLLGLALAVAAAHAIGSLLYGVDPGSPLFVGLATAGLGAVAIAAAGFAARRASAIDPATALRAE